MTREDKLAKLKILVGDPNTTDEVLSIFLDIATSKVLNKAYPYNDTVTEIPPKYEYVELEIAVYLYHKRGGEGEVQHTENGISRTYESASVPKSMLRDVIPFVGVIK